MRINSRRSVQPAVAMLMLAAMAAPVSSQEVKSYASVFGGANYPQNSDLRVELAGPTTILGTMHYKDGGIAGVALGRRWANGNAIEGELACSHDPLDFETLSGVGTLTLDGGVKAYTLMVNGFHFFENESALTPYIGAGAGIASMRVSALAAGSTDRFRDTDVGFAYQAIAGVSYRIGERTDLALEYRYSGTSRASFTDNPGGTGRVTSRLDRTNQTIVLKLSYSF